MRPKKLDWNHHYKKSETRIEHVMEHSKNSLKKKNHGVFYGNPIAVTDKAWKSRGNIQPTLEGKFHIYRIPHINAGWMGGYGGQKENLNHINIVTLRDTHKIISAYPSHKNKKGF